MKITCQSCQSKYNVADEKVQGKIVKIRCRKCGATIVVNGTGGAEASTNGAPAADGGAAAMGGQWHVNVAENDQRTMTMSELVDAYNAGVVTQDTFIWTDGMDDWRPLAEVETVVNALHASAGQMAIGTPGAFETPGLDAVAAAAAAPMAAAVHGGDGHADMAESAYGGGGGFAAAAAPAAEPKRAAVAKREARARDLFATNVGDEIQTSAPAVPHAMGAAPEAAGAGGLTGQRNENSVLFSLAVLTKNADQRAPQEQTTANREDSGLIDLKALAAKAESVRPPAGAADGDVFTAPIGGLGAPLGAPLGALNPLGTPEAQPKSKLPLYIGAGGGVLVLLVLGIVIGVKLAGPAPMPAASVNVAATVAPPPSATAEPSATASASAAPEPSASAAPAPSVAAKPKWGGGGGGGYHPHPSAGGGGGGGAAAGGGGGAAATPPPAPAPKKAGGDCGCNGDLMCLMKCSTH